MARNWTSPLAYVRRTGSMLTLLALSAGLIAASPAPPDRVRGEVAWDVFGFGAPRAPSTSFAKHTEARPLSFLPDEPSSQSVSIGTVTDGYVVQAVPLPLPGRSYSVLPRQLERHLLYGTRELIDALVDAAEFVEAAHPGSILWLGNIGRHGGGDIPWSVSHNAGRDADLAFYVTDPTGRPVSPPDLLHHGADGRSREYGGYYRFDVPRNWSLVKALILSPHVQMQHLFISDGLRALLLGHARSIGEPPSLVAHAARLLRQPGPEIPHDDHLHVRIYCSRADVGAGCENSGRVHPGVDLHGSVRAGRLRLARTMAESGRAATRAAAIRRLAILSEPVREAAVRQALSDASPEVRLAAVETLGRSDASAVSWLVERWDSEDHPLVQEALIGALGELGGPESGRFFERVLSAPIRVERGARVVDLRVVVADAVRRSERAEPAYRLAALLTEADPELRARAALALAAVTNHADVMLDWRDPSIEASQLEAASARWVAWIDARQDEDRDAWVNEGFARVGYTLTGAARQDAATLALAAGDERPWVRANAQRRLMRMTGNTPASLTWSRQDARTYWTRWVRRNPGRIGSP